MEPEQTTNHKSLIKIILWGIIILAIGVMGYFGSKEAGLFRAAITTTVEGPTNSDQILYIPNNYEANSPDSGTIEIKVGGEGFFNEHIANIQASFNFDPGQIVLDQNSLGYAGRDVSYHTALLNADGNKLIVVIIYSTPQEVVPGDILFTLDLVVDGQLNPDTIINIIPSEVIVGVKIDGVGEAVDSQYADTISPGQIEIKEPQCTSDDWQCDSFIEGQCDANNQETRVCTLVSEDCNAGPDGIYGKPDETRLCTCGADDWDCTNWGACVDGEQTRTCTLPDTCVARTSTPSSPPVSQVCGLNVEGLILSLAQDELNRLDQLPENANQEKRDAFSAAYLMVNSSNALGHTITFNDLGVSDVNIMADDCGTELDCINDIVRDAVDGLLNTLEVEDGSGNQLISASEVPNMAGVIKLEPTVHNPLGWIDMSTTAGDVKILPAMENIITISPTASISLQVVGKFIDGSAQNLSFNQVTWSPQPINQLDNAQLIGGILERGDVAGETSLEAVVQTDEESIRSNQLRVNVPRGPIIENVFIEGAGSITPDDQFILNARVSDVDQIEDIANIQTLLIDSDYDTYDEIMAHAGQGDFIAINPYIDEVEVSEEGGEGEDEGEDEDEDEGGENYRIYRIPVYVPANVFEGSYKLVLEIIDTAGFTAHAVIPIYIGEVATGDVNGDNDINMLDVIMAFEIVNGEHTPTQEQLNAANVDGQNGVTMMDVIMLFELVNQ